MQVAAEAYRRALKLRPMFLAARLGLARVLLNLNKYKEALAEIDGARAARPVYPEASGVEGAFSEKRRSTMRQSNPFAGPLAKHEAFNPKLGSDLRACWKRKGSMKKLLPNIVRLSSSSPTRSR